MDPARPTPPAPSSLTPPYTPAPHLTSNSFLTASQLVYYLQGLYYPSRSPFSVASYLYYPLLDFHASFERTPQAPEYLFERLVANVSSCAILSAEFGIVKNLTDPS